MTHAEIPVLPYAGTSGWSGSPTSHARAVTADQSGTTSARQETVLGLLEYVGPFGVTWKELAEATDWHHGTASWALSVLHKDGMIARLATSRSRCRVYVLPEYVGDRETESHGRKARACSNCGHVE
jgi:hypothetical protein